MKYSDRFIDLKQRLVMIGKGDELLASTRPLPAMVDWDWFDWMDYLKAIIN